MELDPLVEVSGTADSDLCDDSSWADGVSCAEEALEDLRVDEV